MLNKAHRKIFLPAAIVGLILTSATPALSVNAANVRETSGREEIDKVHCDSMADNQLRVGEKHVFEVQLFPTKSKFSVSNINFWFYEDEDYNDGEGVRYETTQELMDADGVISRKMTVMRSQPYHVGHAPAKRSQENIITKYEIELSMLDADGKVTGSGTTTQCARWAVTACGDGVVDKAYGEECDDGPDGSASCTAACKKTGR